MFWSFGYKVTSVLAYVPFSPPPPPSPTLHPFFFSCFSFPSPLKLLPRVSSSSSSSISPLSYPFIRPDYLIRLSFFSIPFLCCSPFYIYVYICYLPKSTFLQPINQSINHSILLLTSSSISCSIPVFPFSSIFPILYLSLLFLPSSHSPLFLIHGISWYGS